MNIWSIKAGILHGTEDVFCGKFNMINFHSAVTKKQKILIRFPKFTIAIHENNMKNQPAGLSNDLSVLSCLYLRMMLQWYFQGETVFLFA